MRLKYDCYHCDSTNVVSPIIILCMMDCNIFVTNVIIALLNNKISPDIRKQTIKKGDDSFTT